MHASLITASEAYLMDVYYSCIYASPTVLAQSHLRIKTAAYIMCGHDAPAKDGIRSECRNRTGTKERVNGSKSESKSRTGTKVGAGVASGTKTETETEA